MKDTNNTEIIFKIYPSVFCILTLFFLFSFAAKLDISLINLSNNFRWKKDLITLYSSFRFWIGDCVYSTALVGKDGWVFYTGGNSIQDYQKNLSFEKTELINFVDKLIILSNTLNNQGKTLLIVIPPNKSTVYRKYMPNIIPVLGEDSLLDLFLDQSKQRGFVNVIDLRKSLMEASKNQEVYFKIDTHWNELGAYYGYYDILSFFSDYDSRLVPHSLSNYEYLYKGDLINPDLPDVLGIPPINEPHWILRPKFPVQSMQTIRFHLSNGGFISKTVGSEEKLPRLLVFHDSFYSARNSLSHFIEPHFSNTTSILFTQDSNIWSLNWIQQEEPDFVIIEIVERNFYHGISSLLGTMKE